MKRQFQSKAVPRGTRTIWRYLGAFILFFALGIGQMWGESATITIGSSTSTSYAATFTSSSTNTHVTANATSFTKGSGVSTSNSTYGKATAPYSVKYKPSSNLNTSTYSDANSISAQFTVATGYTFAPSAISATIVTEAANYTYQAVLTDGTTTYTSSDVSSSADGKSTFSFTSLSGKALSGTVTFKIWYKSTANNKKFFVVNLPITITGTVTASGGGGGGNVDPEFTYTPATYILGSVDPLDLSTKLTSTNTTGAITFAIKDAAGTGASIANSKNFTATAAGTAKVTVTQAASTGYNAKSQDIDVTVAAAEPVVTPRNLFTITMTHSGDEVSFEGSQLSELGDYGTATGGYVTLWNKDSSSGKIKINKGSGVCFNGGNAFVVLYLNEPLHEGDKFTFAEGSTSNNRQIRIGLVGTQNTYTAETEDLEYTIPAESELIGKQVIYLARVGSATYFKTLTISSTTAEPTFRTVTFDPNYTSATNITRTVADGAKVVYVPKDPENGTQEFLGWFEGSAASAFDFSTAITADKTLTAHWSAPVIKHTVTYYDGSTKVGEEEVVENASPVNYANYQAKALHSFTNWKNNADAVIDPASLVVTKDTALYAHWAKVYIAQDANYVFENTTTVGTAPNAITVTKDNKPNAIAADSRIDNMWLSAMSVKLEDGTYPGSGDDFYGWKINTSGATIRFYVENDCRVTVTVGNLSSGLNITYTGKSAAEEATTALTAKQANNYDVKGGTLVTLTTAGGNTVTLKGIAVGDIPDLSDDASLSDLTLKYGTAEAATISGFASTKQIYYVEAPYGTAKADLPIVGATATDATNALVTINQAKDREDWKTVIRVQAEDRIVAHDMYYEVRFKVQPKLGVEIIKAVTTTANDGDATGYIGGTYKNTKIGNAVKLDKNNHFGLVIAANNAFQEGDIFAMNITAAAGGNMGTMKIYESTDATEPLFESTEIGTVGMNYWTLPASVNGKTSLYIKRGGGDDWNPTFSSIAVYRLMAPFIEEFAITGVEDFVIDQENKTITASVANTFDVTALTPTVKYWGNGGGAIDKTGAQNFTNPVQYTVSSAYSEDATGDYAPVTYTVTINKIVPSVAPTITTQPAGANYVEGASIAALTVVAESTAGELSYQWQVKNGLEYEDIDGATATTYAPAVSAIGSYVYRVVVTNTEESKPATSVNSNDATIVIAADPACATFLEAGIPTEAPYKYVNTGEWTLYNANSSGKDYSSNNAFTTGKNFQGESVKVFSKERCVLIFEKDMKQVRFYAAECERDWVETAPVKVSEDVEAFLDGGTPSYTTESANTSMNNSYATDGKCRILTAQGNFEAGKCYWFSFTGGVKIFQICAVEADPKAEAPVFSGTLSDEAICPGNSFATLDATASPVTSYAWYKDDEVIAGATAATYTPTEAGTYYCIATNSAAGYRSASTKSAEAVLSVNTVTAITAHVDAVGTVDAEKTISVTAEGTNLTYQWQACDANGDVTDATVLGTAVSLNVVIAAETKYYLATVTGACGVETQVVEAREWHEVEPVNVTGSRVWNWTSAAFNGIDEAIAFGNTSVEELIANVSSKVPNYESFRSDMLYGTGQYVWRPNDRYFQGFKVRFVTTVPGIVKVTYRGTGNNKNIILSINDSTYAEYQGGFTTVKNFVQAGEVVIEGVGGTGNAGGMTRIQRIEFVAEADYTREVNAGRYGTICLPNGGVMVGATLYEVAYYGETSKKIFFDEILNGTMEAGVPYIYLPNEGADKLAVFYTDEADESAKSANGLVGYIGASEDAADALAVPAGEGNYILNNNQYREVVYANSAYILSHRAYIKLAAINPTEPALAPGRRRISMGVQGEQVVTGMENLNASEQPVKVLINGQIFILRGEKMYDATGRLVK